MKLAFLFNGQGSQFETMGLDFYESQKLVRDFYDSLDFPLDIKKLSFSSNLETLSQTKYTQPVILAFHIGILKLLESKNIKPDLVLGLSLGEYSALYSSGILSEKDVLDSIIFRSQEMSKVENDVDSKMIAVITDDLDLIKKLITPFRNAYISNINTLGQIVLSGQTGHIEAIDKLLKENKIKTITLNTSGPFHTPYMDQVSEKLSDYFQQVDFKQPKLEILYNLHGKQVDRVNIKETMALQVSNTVLFKDSLIEALNKDIDLFVEIGASKTISKFIKKIDKNVKVLGISNIYEFETLIKEVESFEK